jgi:hypothetical protein
MRRPLIVGVVAGLILGFSGIAHAQDAWMGTWKLNLAKSKYEPANLAPKSTTTKLEAVAGGGMKTTTDTMDYQGKKMHQEITTTFDGKGAPLKDAPDPNTTRVYRRVDARSYEFVTAVNGKVTTTTRSVLSADAKTRTNTTTGTDAQGHTVKNVAVFERQ